jgi:hypothetical protein
MFTRNLTQRLRAKSASEFVRLNGDDLVPLLRKQKGFRDGATLITPTRPEALAISMLDKREASGA